MYDIVEPYKTPLNLLSGKGEKQLQKLTEFQEKFGQEKSVMDAEFLWKNGEDHQGFVETLLSITTPLYFDLSLYKDFTPIFRMIDQLVTCMGYVFVRQNSLSISSGCKNGCPHCGIEAVAPVGIFLCLIP